MHTVSPETKYSELKSNCDDDHDVCGDGAFANKSVWTWTYGSVFGSKWMSVVNAALFLTLVTSLILICLWPPLDANQRLQQVSFYSPLFNRYDIQFEQNGVAGALFNEKTLTKHDLLLRSYPNDEVDTEWERIAKIGYITVSADEVQRLGRDPSKTVKIPEDLGYGSNAYVAQIDGQHNLHCLNAVRRYAYREYYFPETINVTMEGKDSPFSEIHRAHLSHCLHMLLQTLTCKPSFDIITHQWVEGQMHPFPDFDINKKCVRHDQLLDWQSSHALAEAQFEDMALRGPGPEDVVFPMEEEMRKWSVAQDRRKAKGWNHK